MNGTLRRVLLTLILTAALFAPLTVWADDAPAASPPAAAAPTAPSPTTAVTPTPLTAYIPSSTAVLVGIDSKWLWDSTEPIREVKEVKAGLSEAQAVLNVSPDTDIMPWLGHTYVAFLPGSDIGSAPRLVVYAEIRDPAEFATDAARIKANVADRPHVGVTTVQVDGKDVVKVTGPGKGSPQLIFVVDGGWVILTTDGVAIHRVLDTLTGSYSSISTNAAFVTAFASAQTPGSDVWAALNSKPFNELMRNSAASGKAAGSFPPVKAGSIEDIMSKGVSTVTLTDKTTSLRLDTVGYTVDPRAQAYFQKLQGEIKPVTGESLSHMPNDTFVSVIGQNPMTWVRVVEETLAGSSSAALLQGFDIMAAVKPYEPILDAFTGEFNLGGVVHDGKFGVSLICQTDSQQSAQKTLGNIVTLLGKYQVPLNNNNGVYTLSGMPDQAMFPVSPSLRAVDGYVEATSATQWFDAPTGAPTLQVPSDSTGSMAMELGSFRFADALIAMAQKADLKDPAINKFIVDLNQLRVSDATWSFWSRIDDGGATSTGAFMLDNLDWKATIQAVANLASAESAAQKSPAHPSPAH